MLREKLNGIMVVAMVAIFTSCGVGSAPPQSGININICNSAGTTGDCSQEAANTNTAQISQPGGGGGIPPIPPIPPPGGDGGVDGDGGHAIVEDRGWLGPKYTSTDDTQRPPVEDLAEEVGNTMPDWDGGIADVDDGQTGTDTADPDVLGEIIEDTEQKNWQEIGEGFQAARTQKGIYIRNAASGYLSAYNRDLARQAFTLTPVAPDTGTFASTARLGCQAAFDIQQAELGESSEQIKKYVHGSTGFDFVNKTVTDKYSYVHISIGRVVNGIPVSGSTCNIVFHPVSGKVLFAEAVWPTFKLVPGMTSVRMPPAVADAVLQALAAEIAPELILGISQRLVYVTGKMAAPGIFHMPALRTTVYVGENNQIESAPELYTLLGE